MSTRYRRSDDDEWERQKETASQLNVNPELVSPEDVQRLDQLGFIPDSDGDGFMSFRFGSC